MDMGGLGDIGGTSDFQFARRFFCRELPDEFDDGDAPTLIVQSYFVHEDDYALRIRLQTRAVRVPMSAQLDPKAVLERYRDDFREATLTVKGPSRGGTRYEAQRSIDSRVAATSSSRTAQVCGLVQMDGTSTCSAARTPRSSSPKRSAARRSRI